MGIVRLYLAMSVLLFHIGAAEWFPVVKAGVAVYSFFLLSGFYISMGLSERYTQHGSNLAFYASRFIRLWPTYLISLGFMAYAGVLQQGFGIMLEDGIVGIFAIFANITMIGHDALIYLGASHFTLNVPAWSLSAEILFYAAAPFVVRSLKRAIIFLSIGIIFAGIAQITKALDIPLKLSLMPPYFMLFFGLGMAAYWLNRQYPASRETAKYYAAIAIAVFVVVPWKLMPFVYVALMLLTPMLFNLTKDSAADRFLGDLSYPIYILHVPVGMALRNSGWLAEIAPIHYFAASIIAAVVVLLVVERPFDKLRGQFIRNLTRRHGVDSRPVAVA